MSELGYRPCVGVMLVNSEGRVFVGRRIDNKEGDWWQMPQGGVDEGEDIKDAALRELAEETGAKAEHVTLIQQTAEPIRYDLPEELIHEAFSSLETHDAVVGPSVDGGYYLIGFRNDAFLPEVFEGIQWSTDTVFEETFKILEQAELSVCKLLEWRDIDTLSDLKSMFLRNKNENFRSSRTMWYIAENAWLERQLLE